MRRLLWALRPIGRTLLSDESGQDLVEYAFIVVLIALSVTAAMSSIAGGINRAFLAISARFDV